MAASGTLVIRFIGDLREFERSTKSLAGKLKKTGSTLTRSLTLPIVGLGAAMLKTAADFEAGMLNVQALTGATGQEFDQLRQLAKDLGATTQFSATQASEGMGFLAMAGFEVNEILSAMPGVLDLATAGSMELADAADIASNVLSGFGLEAGEITRVGDVLAKTFTSTNTDLTMLGESMKMVASVAAPVGLSIEEVSAAIGLMGNAGIQGTMAGTSLRGSITRLINPTKQQAELIAELGLNVMDASGNMVPFVDIIRQLESSGASTAQIMGLFGQRAGPAMAALLSEGSGALAELTGKLENSGGTMSEIADTKMQGLSGAIKELKSAWEAFSIALADAGALQMFTDLAKSAAEFFRNLAETNPTLLKLILIVAALAAVLGPLMIVLSALITAFGTIAAAAGAVGAVFAGIALGPALLIIGAIVAIGGTIYLLIKHWDTIKRVTIQVWNAIVGFFKSAGSKIVSMVSGAFTAAKDWAIRKAGELVGWMRGLPGRILSALGNLGSLLTGAGRSIITGLWNGIKAMGSWLKSKIVGFIKSFVPGPVLRFLGISSPSKLFADIGKEIPAGLAQGILGNTREVERASRYMVSTTVQPARSPMSPERAAAAAAGSRDNDDAATIAAAVEAALGRMLGTIPVNVYSEFNVDGQKLASSVEQGLLDLRRRR